MTNTAITVLSNYREDPEEVPGLLDQVKATIAEHDRQVMDVVERWILYCVDMGQRTLPLDTCPGISKRDQKMVIHKLRELGFEVNTPRLWGLATININAVE